MIHTKPLDGFRQCFATDGFEGAIDIDGLDANTLIFGAPTPRKVGQIKEMMPPTSQTAVRELTTHQDSLQLHHHSV